MQKIELTFYFVSISEALWQWLGVIDSKDDDEKRVRDSFEEL